MRCMVSGLAVFSGSMISFSFQLTAEGTALTGVSLYYCSLLDLASTQCMYSGLQDCYVVEY